MAQFFKYFFAALLALVVFSMLVFMLLMGLAGILTSKEELAMEPHSVLYLDLGKQIFEKSRENPLAALTGEDPNDYPGVFDMVRLINQAGMDDQVDGIYLKVGSNANGFATNEEIRNALVQFRASGKFIMAYGEFIPQQAYHVATAANFIYAHPRGGLEWKGLGLQYVFFKKALDNLQIEPQVFYAGKFKSATEPFRAEAMSEPNRIQSRELLEDIYGHFLSVTASARKLDTQTLRRLADDDAIRTAEQAVRTGLLDGLRYEDEVKEEIRRKTGSSGIEKIPFVSMGAYAQSARYKAGSGTERIALIFAEGNIVDGDGDETNIGGDKFRKYIRRARLDQRTKAIVIRVNSGGGSAMASENMWREIELAKKDKPVVVSFGDVAASGGYYMACNADSIFALPNTITGSIGVFSIIPNMKGFFSNKVGITFDGVETGPHANAPSITEPLSEMEKRYFQAEVDSIYQTFLTRVAQGRKMKLEEVDSIGQGRIWTGNRALSLKLTDRIGGMADALAAAAKLAGLREYRVREYPEDLRFLEKLSGAYRKSIGLESIRKEIGEQWFAIYNELQTIKATTGKAQMKMPYQLRFY